MGRGTPIEGGNFQGAPPHPFLSLVPLDQTACQGSEFIKGKCMSQAHVVQGQLADGAMHTVQIKQIHEPTEIFANNATLLISSDSEWKA